MFNVSVGTGKKIDERLKTKDILKYITNKKKSGY